MRNLYLILTFSYLLCLAASPAAFGQSRPLQGKVIDQETRQPLAGANVAVAHTQRGTVTDQRGYFSLQRRPGDDTLRVSFVGYATEKIALAGRRGRDLVVGLQPSSEALSPLVVQGARAQQEALRTPQSVETLAPEDFARHNPLFLQNALNQLAGVAMEQRSTASQSHILIRGVGGKSRFNERGIKLYLDGIPLTRADGTTSLNYLDFTTIGRARVLKGPAPTYGTNTGGVVQLSTERIPQGQSQVFQSVTGGGYGLLRTSTGAKIGTEESNILLNYGYQNLDGYRAHAQSKKRFLTLSGDVYASERRTISVLGLYTSIDDQFPGEVARDAYQGDPQGAFFIYENRRIGNEQNRFLGGVTQNYFFTPRFSNTTSLFAGGGSQEQPIEPFFVRGQSNRYGARSLFALDVKGERPATLTLGGEYLRDFTTERHYAISDSGEAGAVNSDREAEAQQANLFARAEWDVAARTTLTGGAGLNWVSYDLTDLYEGDGTDFSGDRSFDPVLTPRVGLIQRLGSDFAAYANVSAGFSPPTVSEVSLPDGSFNEDTGAERSLQYEVGARGRLFEERLQADASVFYLTLDDQLIRQELEPGFAGYVNAGSSRNLGGELMLSYRVPVGSAGLLEQVRPFVSYSYNDFAFQDYAHSGTAFDDNDVPGVAPHRLYAGLDVATRYGLSVHASYAYVGERALDDGNTAFVDRYSLLDLRLNYAQNLGRHVRLKLFGGVSNLTDELYSPIVAVNQQGFGDNPPRYFNPAPGRRAYGSVALSYTF